MSTFDTPAFPEGTKFSDLFAIVAKEDVRAIVRKSPAWTNVLSNGSSIHHRLGEETGKIGGYFTWTDEDGSHHSFYVQPTQKLVDWINKNMIIVNHDTIHFEGGVRGSDFYVTVNYGQIIGSRFLAVFPDAEVRMALSAFVANS